MIRKDYIERMIEQFAEAIARLLRLRKEGKHAEAIQAVREDCVALFGVEYDVLVGVDAASAAGLLGSPVKMRHFARLVREEAESLEAMGQSALAERRRVFADTLTR